MALAEIMFAPLMIGLSHSFESDHLVAVGNLVSVKSNWRQEALRGALWGLGHTVSVFAAAFSFQYLQKAFGEPLQWPFEIFVGIMLVIIGAFKLAKLFQQEIYIHSKAGKSVFFKVGLVHGLAGSGSVAVLLSSQVANHPYAFLILFGIGTVLGMAFVTSLLTKISLLKHKYINIFSGIVALLSLGYGFKILYSQIS